MPAAPGMTTAPLSDRGRDRGEREGAVRSARGGARRSERAIRAEQPRADAARRQRRVAERHRPAGRAGLSGEVRGRARRLSVGVFGSNYGTASMGSSSVYMGSTMYPSPMYDPFYSSYYYYSPFAYPYYWGPSYSYRYGSPFYRNYYNYNNYYGLGGGGYYGVAVVRRPAAATLSPAHPTRAAATGRRQRVAATRESGRRDQRTARAPARAQRRTSRTPGSTRGVRSAGSSGSDSSSSSIRAPSSSSGSSSSGSSSSGGYSSGGGGGVGGGGADGAAAVRRDSRTAELQERREFLSEFSAPLRLCSMKILYSVAPSFFSSAIVVG